MISFTTIYGSNFNLSYGQISLVPDNSLIAQTTDCITSMMTSALIGVDSDCRENISKINSTFPDSKTTSTNTPTSTSSSNQNPDNKTTSTTSNATSTNTPTSTSSSNQNPYNLSKNNPFYHEFQTKDTTTSDDMSVFTSESSSPINSNYAGTFASPPHDNPSTFMKTPPHDNPSTFSEFQQQSVDQPVSNLYSVQSLQTIFDKHPNTAPTFTQSDIGDSLEGKNKHSKEISACFDRAFSIDNYLSDSEIIECAKDRDSFSQNNLNNDTLNDKIENNDDNNNNDGETDNKHSKEISACFDRAFSIDNYLSDSEIIECAKDRDSFK
ncbi:hypothetical protein [Candidatus Nitrosocosmicus franklandus]|uniref:hypothetical protein n=1 Tax=Candidatus Nitrosocosmicus franklandianus TaxID=1798806 RepID=UPI001559586C|nr:hypothetical protein [Candidatus Nitrosocosmicus franklandus]